MSGLVYVCLGLGLASALVGGVFQSFSDFVMRGLIRAAPAGGMESMQQLNRTVFRSVFLALFFALVPATGALAVYAWFSVTGSTRVLLVAAAIVYLLLVFVVTAAGNVPMNRRLDGLAHTSAEGHAYWTTYGRVWTWWNHLRTLGSVVTAVCLLLASVQLAAGSAMPAAESLPETSHANPEPGTKNPGGLRRVVGPSSHRA
ncbi:MAG: anthrone oxygenase family protein [Myxococcota bacterium]